MYRRPHDGPGLEVLLVHPGGPFWARKDLGAWSVPKGEIQDDEDPFTAAQREFKEELGFPVGGEFLRLSPVKQKSGKVVSVWAVEGDLDPARVRSNTFSMEYPPRSGRTQEFPEVDRAEWFSLDAARTKILPAQEPLIVELETLLSAP
jgi:predicted NUDIX family NTP pyrophosphohydrolase